MSEPEFPLCSKDDPRVPVVVDMLRKSMLMGGNFTLDARRILAALDRQEEATGGAHSPASGRTDAPRHTDAPRDATDAQEAPQRPGESATP
jgi:hypothetical protein